MTMFDNIKRFFHIENREPPIPDVIQIASADVIGQIFAGDVARQTSESTRSSYGGAISFNHRRK
jgi:hypothetical protein